MNRDVPAVLLLEDPRIEIDSQTVAALLRGVGELVGRSVCDWTLAVRGLTSGTFTDRLHDLLPALVREERLERGLPVIADAIRGLLEIDYISITWLGRSRFHEDRASMVTGEGRIVENRRAWPVAETTRRAATLRRAIITPDLRMAHSEDMGNGEAWESRVGMGSRLVAPIMDGTEVSGTLTFAHRLPARFGEDEMLLTSVLCDILSLWLQGLSARRENRRSARAEEFVTELLTNPSRWADEQEVLRETQSQVDVSGMRLFRLNPSTGGLIEMASAGRVRSGAGQESLALGRLPWHRCALESERPLCIDQDDPEAMMDLKEAALTMTSALRTATIVPVMSQGERLGFLDVMEMRDPDRKALNETDQLVLRALAEHLARLWTPPFTPVGRSGDGDRAHEFVAAIRDLRRDIVNPITSIVGSVELIRHKQPELNGEAVKYLATIEKSATRIQKATTTFHDTVAPDEPSDGIVTKTKESGNRASVIRSRPHSAFARPASVCRLEPVGEND